MCGDEKGWRLTPRSLQLLSNTEVEVYDPCLSLLIVKPMFLKKTIIRIMKEGGELLKKTTVDSAPVKSGSCFRHHNDNNTLVFSELLLKEPGYDRKNTDRPQLHMQIFSTWTALSASFHVQVVMLVLAWKLDAQSMGYFTRQEWLRGMSSLQYVT